MRRFKSILVVQDGSIGSEAALRRGENLADVHRARLTVAEILREFPRTPKLDLLTEHEASLRSRYRAERHARLRRLSSPAQQLGLDVAIEVFEGTSHVEIVRSVIRHRHDLVIITDGVRSLRTMAFGNTASQLLRKCPCPVWVVKPRPPKDVCRVVAAVECTSGDPRLDREVISVASSLARAEGCRLDLFHSWDFAGRDLETSRSECTMALREGLRERRRAACEESLRALASEADLSGLDWQIRLHKGDLEPGLAAFAEEGGVDLVVMGITSRRGISGLLAGGTAERLVQHVSFSVVGVKHPSFTVPFELSDPRSEPQREPLTLAN